MNQIHSDLEKALQELPDQVARALEQWRKATLDREKLEAMLAIRFRGEDPDKTATEIRALINASLARYESVLQEIAFEAIYTAKYETLLCKKREAAMRIAY